MNVKKLKTQLRKGGWHTVARNLEFAIMECGLPIRRRAYPSRPQPTVNIELVNTTSPAGILGAYLDDGRLVADEEQMYFKKPSVRSGPPPRYVDDGSMMETTSIRLPKSLRKRIEHAYPHEPLASVVRDCIESHLQSIGR